MRNHCVCFLSIIAAVSAASLPYLPQPTSSPQAVLVQKEFYVYSAPVEQPRRQPNAPVVPKRQQSYAHRKPTSTSLASYAVKYKYRTAEEVIQAIVQQYGVKVNAPATTAATTQRVQQLNTQPAAAAAAATGSALSRNYHLVNAANEPSAASTHTVGHAILPPNTPVQKNYAQNFLPSGTDVVPGSSYIPLLLKH